MKELELSITILEDILDNGAEFNESLRKFFVENIELRPYRAAVSGLVGCALRHHLLFAYLCKDLEGYEESDRRVLSICLANDFYAKRFTPEEMLEGAKEYLSEEKLALAAPLFALIGKPEEYVPASLPRSSNTYLSLRYNVPEWVLKVFQHYGFGNTYKTLRELNKPVSHYLRVRTSVLPFGDVVANVDFKPLSSVNDMVLYTGKTPLRKNEWYASGRIYEEKPLIKKLVEENLVSEPCEIFLYNGNKDSAFERELLETYGSSVALYLGTPNVDEKIEVRRLIKEKGLRNVDFFNVRDVDSMKAAITKMSDLVICAPKSTNFDSINASPDFFLHFDKEAMDSIFAAEKQSLEDCSKFVEVGGKLLYCVFTISKKEGHNTIAEFLRLHPEFYLEKENQYFPFEENATSAYVATLVKGEKPLTIGTPVGDLSSVAPKASSAVSSASEAK